MWGGASYPLLQEPHCHGDGNITEPPKTSGSAAESNPFPFISAVITWRTVPQGGEQTSMFIFIMFLGMNFMNYSIMLSHWGIHTVGGVPGGGQFRSLKINIHTSQLNALRPKQSIVAILKSDPYIDLLVALQLTSKLFFGHLENNQKHFRWFSSMSKLTFKTIL